MPRSEGKELAAAAAAAAPAEGPAEPEAPLALACVSCGVVSRLVSCVMPFALATKAGSRDRIRLSIAAVFVDDAGEPRAAAPLCADCLDVIIRNWARAPRGPAVRQ